MRILATALTVLGAGCSFATVGSAQVWNPKTAAWNIFSQGNASDPIQLQSYTSAVQEHLNRMHCYNDDVDNIDALWGTESRQAFERLRKRVGGNFPQSARASAEQFLVYLQGLPDRHCGAASVRRSTERVCRRSEVGRNFLTSRAKEIAGASALGPTLGAFNEAFNKIFPPGEVNPTAGWSQNDVARLDAVAGNRVTHASAKKALEAAAHQLAQLSFAYGMSSNRVCAVCYQVNDWIYLRNIAQSNGGVLMYMEDLEGGRKAFRRADVSTVTESMLTGLLPFIRIHRGASTNLELHLSHLEMAKLPDGMDRAALAKKVPLLIQERDAAMRQIIDKLRTSAGQPAAQGPAASTPDRPMRTLAGIYACEGFDGSSLDQ